MLIIHNKISHNPVNAEWHTQQSKAKKRPFQQFPDTKVFDP